MVNGSISGTGKSRIISQNHSLLKQSWAAMAKKVSVRFFSRRR